ncbi:MAG TPA: DinB family protein [Dehalococcoidia bacterium]|nr:DinB family protein [Dehalococcoidia bacterium]
MEIATLRQALETSFQENRALISALSDADLARRTPNPKWRVRQLAAHIAQDDGGTTYVGKLLARGKNAKAPDLLINLANWWGLRKYRKAHAADLLPVMDQKHRDLLAWIETLTPEQLQRDGEISQLGRMTLGEFLDRNQQHSREHGNEIRAALGQSRPARERQAG